MRAIVHLDRNSQKVLDRRVNDAVNRERDDIAKRALYITLLACWQAGLSPRTLRKIQAAMPAVAEKYKEYRADSLADVWAQVTLQDMGVDVEETEERL